MNRAHKEWQHPHAKNANVSKRNHGICHTCWFSISSPFKVREEVRECINFIKSHLWIYSELFLFIQQDFFCLLLLLLLSTFENLFTNQECLCKRDGHRTGKERLKMLQFLLNVQNVFGGLREGRVRGLSHVGLRRVVKRFIALMRRGER